MPSRRKSKIDLHNQWIRIHNLVGQNMSEQNLDRLNRVGEAVVRRQNAISNTKSYQNAIDRSQDAMSRGEFDKSAKIMSKAQNRKYSVNAGSVG